MSRHLEVKCSFCGKQQSQVAKVVAGPGVWICNECITLCNEIMSEELAPTRQSGNRLPREADVIERAATVLSSVDPALASDLRAITRPADPDPGE